MADPPATKHDLASPNVRDEEGDASDDTWYESAFASRYASAHIPKNRLPDDSMPSHVAYQLIKDMRQLDSNPRLNLASFVTTWMEPEADRLITESLNVNFVDMDEYPSTTDIQNRCVRMLANLYHAPDADAHPTGTATVGSSEAIMLSGLAMKKAWQKRRQAEGKPTDKPNLVMSYTVQVCWEKFCRYWDVEERFVPVEDGKFVMQPEEMAKVVDENTIGVCGILGSTYNGEFEDIKGFDAALEEINAKTGWGIKIHVDAASGGFVAPFLCPNLEWDFRLKNVVSINVSGHKYGLVYPGVGWVVWRDPDALPAELVFWTNYLGSDQPSITLNFSKGAATIVAQYYQFLRLGRHGYTKIMRNLRAVARRLASGIEETGHFKLQSNHDSLPLVAFTLLPQVGTDGREHERNYNEFDISDKLKARGWILPAYTMAPNARHVRVLRAVVREDLSMTMADSLVEDIVRCVEHLDTHFTYTAKQMDAINSRLNVSRLDSSILRGEVKHNGVC